MEEKKSRWNDTSSIRIIHKATEEEKKKATDEMFENLIKNSKKVIDEYNRENKK